VSDSVGSVSVDVVPDARGWAEKLRAQIRDVTVQAKVKPEVDKTTEEEIGRKGKTSGDKFAGEFDRVVQTRIRAALAAIPDLKIGADASEAETKLGAIRAEIASLSDPQKIGLTNEEALAKIEVVRGELKSLAADSPDIRVNVDALAAEAKLAEIQAQIDGLHGKKVNVRTGSSSIGKAESGLSGIASTLGVLPALAIAAGAALVPLAAVLGGIATALAAPLAIAGGGATLFAFFAGAAIKQTQAQLKQVDTLKKNVDSARVSYEQAVRSAGKHANTSTAVANAQDRLTKATAAYQVALKGISPQQRAFGSALDGLKSTFAGMVDGPTGRAILQPFTDGLNLLAYVLRASGPLIRTVAGAFGDLLSNIQQSVSTPGFSRFLDQFARLAGRDIRIGGHILGELAKGVGSLLLATDQGFSGGFLRGLDHLSTSFADWASSKSARHDMRELFGYVHDNGPQVGHTLGAIAHAAGQLIDALAPLGPPVLKGIEGMANAISAIPVPVLTGLAAAFVAATAAAKVSKGLSALTSLGGLGGGKGGVAGELLGGVQKVYVVNMGPGGLEGGGPGGVFGKTLGKGALTFTVADVALYAGAVAFSTAASYEIWKHVAKQSQIDALNSQAQSGILPTLGSNAPHQASQNIPGLAANMLHPRTGGEYVFNPVTQGYDWTKFSDKVGTHFDALRANLAKASRQIDLIGPHADAAFGAAAHDVDTFAGKLAAIKDKKLSIILQDQAAIRSLEALQRMRIQDKNFNVYAHYQQIERAPGPGGGMGQNPHGSAPSSGSGGGAGDTPVHIHLDENGRTTLSGYMQGQAQNVYDENQRFQGAHG
jgi:hypothetical protein